jgi:hypothetical protein
MIASLNDYTQVRTVLAASSLIIITVALFTKYLEGGAFAASLSAILACYSAHSIFDDKYPDRNAGPPYADPPHT